MVIDTETTGLPKTKKNIRTCNKRGKTGIKRMPTHYLANRLTPDKK